MELITCMEEDADSYYSGLHFKSVRNILKVSTSYKSFCLINIFMFSFLFKKSNKIMNYLYFCLCIQLVLIFFFCILCSYQSS